MSRSAATIEYRVRLVDWAGGETKFCALTGILQPNLTAYLAGTKNISWARLRSATQQVFGTPPAFVPELEGFDVREKGKPKATDLPRTPGIYAFFDSAMRVIYYGKATSLYQEVRQTLDRSVAEVRPWTGAKNLTFQDITTYLSAYTIVRGDAEFRHDIEALGLRVLVNNTFNKNGGTFKRTS